MPVSKKNWHQVKNQKPYYSNYTPVLLLQLKVSFNYHLIIKSKAHCVTELILA